MNRIGHAYPISYIYLACPMHCICYTYLMYLYFLVFPMYRICLACPMHCIWIVCPVYHICFVRPMYCICLSLVMLTLSTKVACSNGKARWSCISSRCQGIPQRTVLPLPPQTVSLDSPVCSYELREWFPGLPVVCPWIIEMYVHHGALTRNKSTIKIIFRKNLNRQN